MGPKRFDKRFSKTIALVMALLLASTTLTGCNWFEPREEEASSSIELEVPEPDAQNSEEETEDESEMSAEVDPDLEEEPDAEVGEVVEEPQAAPDSSADSASAGKGDTFIDSSTVFSNKNDQKKEAVTTSALMPETVIQPEQVTNVVYEPVGTSVTDTEQTKLLAQPTAETPRATTGKSYANARFKKKGSYSESKVYKHGYVDAGSVTISNKTFTGNLYIDVSSGTVTLKNVEVQGKIYVNGGSDWVKLYDVQAGGMVVESSDTSRIFASRDTVVSGVTVKTDTILEEGGLYSGSDGFKNVTVNGAKGTTLTLKNLKLNKLKTVTACDVVYDNDTVINYAYTEAATELYGYGQINRLYCSSNGVYYDSKPLYIETERGYATPSRRTSSGGSGSGSSTEDKKVTLYSISDQYLDVGSSRVVGIDHNGSSLKVTTSNASVAKVTYSTSKSHITMKGLKPGKATIKVTSSRSGYQSVTTSFQIVVRSNGSSSIQLSGISNQYLDEGDVRYVSVNTDASSIRVTNSDNAVADVSVDGFQLRIRGKKAGTATVKVIASRAGRTSKSTTFKVTVRGSSVSDDYVQIRPIDNQILGRGSERVINVNTDGSSLKATSSDTNVAKVTTRWDDTLVVEAMNPGSAWITVTSSRRGYRDNSVKFRVDVHGDTISAPTVYLNLESSSGTSYTSGSWTNKDVVFTLTGYNESRTAYVYERPAGTTQWGNRQTVSNNRFTVTAEGEKDYYFFTRGSGGDSKATAIYTVRVDKTKPVVNVTDTSNGTMKITATDSLSNILSVLIYNEAGKELSPSGYENGVYIFHAPEAGNYRVEVTDQAGNVATSGTYKLDGPTKPDSAAPVITINNKPEDKWYNTDQKVSFTVTDDIAAPSVEVSPKEAPLSHNGNQYELTANQEGTVTYTITAKDTSGKTTTQNLTVKFDKTAPVIESVTNQEMQVEIKVSDPNGSGINKVTAVQTGTNSNQVVSPQNGVYTFTAEKNVQYTITAIDNAGNESKSTYTVQDTTPTTPTVTIGDVSVSDSDKLTKSKWVAFTIDAELAKDQSLSVQVSGPDNSTQSPVSTLGVKNTYRFEVTKNGVYTIEAQVKDASGNVIQNASKTQTVSKIDSTAPAIVVTGNENGRITFTVTDETECKVTFDGKINDRLSREGNVQTHAVTGVGNGTYTITATDAAGNHSTAEVVVSVKVKPTMLAESSTLYSTNQKDASTVITVNAPGSAVKSVTVDRSGASIQKDSENKYRITATENGTYTVQAVAENGMSETLSLNVQGIKKETAPPSIQTGEQQVNATFTEVTAPITVTDVDTDLGKLTVQADKGSLTGEKGSYKLTATENGSYTITAKDEDNQPVSVVVQITEVKGMIAPTVQTGTVTVSDKTAQVPVTVSENGGTAIVSVTDQNGTALANQGNGSYLLTADQNGSYTITAKNAAGKTASATVTVNHLDSTAPTISEPQITYSTDKKDATILFTVADPQEGKPSGVAAVTFAGTVLQQTAGGYQTKVTENGTYTIIATDAAGNSSDKTVKVDGIDKAAPVIQRTSKNDAWAKQQVVTFSVTDDKSGVQSVSVTKSGAAVQVDESKGYSFTAAENGTYTIVAKDFAGNTSQNFDVVIKTIDKTAPAAPKLMSGKKEVSTYKAKNKPYGAKDTQTFTIAYTKAAEGESPVSIKVKIDKEDYKTLPENQLTLKLKAGDHTVLIKAVDAAGNESAVQTYQFKVTSEQGTNTTTETQQTESTEQKAEEPKTEEPKTEASDSKQEQPGTAEPSDPKPAE